MLHARHSVWVLPHTRVLCKALVSKCCSNCQHWCDVEWSPTLSLCPSIGHNVQVLLHCHFTHFQLESLQIASSIHVQKYC